MKPKTPLLECFAKIEWAEAQIEDFTGRVNALFPSPPKILLSSHTPGSPIIFALQRDKFASHIDTNGVEVWRYNVPEIPTEFSVMAGAIMYALRSPLDQMLTTIAQRERGTHAGVAFPVSRNWDEFKAAVAKQEKLLPRDAIKMIRALKPYRAGNPLLSALHYWNRSDKHHPGLIPINLHTVSDLKKIVVKEGALLTLGPRTGRHLYADADNNFVQPDATKGPIVSLVGDEVKITFGGKVGEKRNDAISRFYNQTGTKARADLSGWLAKTALPPDAAYDDLEFATSIPKTQFDAEVYPAFNVAFSDIEGFERQPAIAVLHQMRQLVHRILLTFEKRFFP